MAQQFPLPSLSDACFDGVPILTDQPLFQATGIRIGFTGREGGVSEQPFAALNLGHHVNDDIACVMENRRKLMRAVGAGSAALVVPDQVHGTQVVVIDSNDADAVQSARDAAKQGADALVVSVEDVAALLNFSDCTPVILVSPKGSFAVAHAGWRGAVAGIVGKTAKALCQQDDVSAEQLNMYIGPHIHVECFECGVEVSQQFQQAFGPECVRDPRHVSLAQAVTADACQAGVDPQRIADCGICTKCNPERYFSYRASGGVCGRHGAFAVRMNTR